MDENEALTYHDMCSEVAHEIEAVRAQKSAMGSAQKCFLYKF
jgi:hypothetical protein